MSTLQMLLRTVKLIASIALIFACLNIFPVWTPTLLLDVEASAAGRSQVFYPSTDNILTEEDSVTRSLPAARSVLAYPLAWMPGWVRWDPSDGAGNYALRGAAVKVGPFKLPIDLKLASPSSQIGSFGLDGNILRFSTTSNATDASVVLQLPAIAFWFWEAALLIASILSVIGLVSFVRWNDALQQQRPRVEAFILTHSRDFGTLGILVGISVLCYFYELGSFSLSVDDEYAASRTDPVIWVSQGRWTTYLIERYLLPEPVTPFFPTFLFCLCLAASYLVITRTHGIKDRAITLFLFPLFCAFPIWFFIAEFYANLPAAGFGLVLIALATFVLKRQVIDTILSERSLLTIRVAASFALQAGLVAVAAGAYQSYLLAYASTAFGTVTISALRERIVTTRVMINQYILVILSLFSSAILYYAADMLMKYALNAQAVYVEGFVRLDPLLLHPVSVIKAWLSGVSLVFLGSSSVFGIDIGTIGLLLVLGWVGLLTYRQKASKRFFAAIGLVIVLLAPFLLNLLSEGRLYNIPFRSLVGLPYVIWFLCALAVGSGLQGIRILAFVFAAGLTFQVFYANSLYQASQTITRAQDRYLAQSIYDRMIATIPNFDRFHVYRMDFFGQKNVVTVYPKIQTSTIGSSFFDWDGGNPHRIVAYMRLIGFDNVAALDNEARRRALPIYADMPLWPAPGSMRILEDGVVLVKLGDKPGAVHQALMN